MNFNQQQENMKMVKQKKPTN